MQAELDALTRSLAGSFAFVGVALCHGGKSTVSCATAPGITADEHSLFRVASVSKIITAAVFEEAASMAGLTWPFDVDVGDILGVSFRHPSYPDTPVTFGMLLSHSAGLSDTGGYALDPLILDPDTAFGPHEPGTSFEYANLGYLILAAAAEQLAGRRFDQIATQDVLQANRVTGGFNWSGVSASDRQRALPTYRRDGTRFVPQIDAPAQPFDPGDDYQLGVTTARCSPQGGLRMSLMGMLTLAKIGAGTARKPLWRKADGPGDYMDGLFADYGMGEQILHTPPFYPRPLVGHFGNAYGFNGGVWSDPQADLCFAYALNGVPMGEESDALSQAERQVFETVAAVP